MAAPHPATIDAYSAAAPAAGQPHLRQLHALLHGVAPKAEQVIKWGLAGIAGAVCGAGGAGHSGLKASQHNLGDHSDSVRTEPLVGLRTGLSKCCCARLRQAQPERLTVH